MIFQCFLSFLTMQTHTQHLMICCNVESGVTFLQAVIIESRHELPDDVEAEKLSGLIELGMLDLGQVQLPVHLVQQVLLDDLVHHDGDKQVEEDGGQVLQA